MCVRAGSRWKTGEYGGLSRSVSACLGAREVGGGLRGNQVHWARVGLGGSRRPYVRTSPSLLRESAGERKTVSDVIDLLEYV